MDSTNFDSNIKELLYLIPMDEDDSEVSFHADRLEDVWWLRDSPPLSPAYGGQLLSEVVEKAVNVLRVSHHSSDVTLSHGKQADCPRRQRHGDSETDMADPHRQYLGGLLQGLGDELRNVELEMAVVGDRMDKMEEIFGDGIL